MQSQDTSNAWAQANSKASAMNTYNADSKAEKKQKRKRQFIKNAKLQPIIILVSFKTLNL